QTAEVPDDKQEHEGPQSYGSIHPCVGKSLQSVDQDLVGRLACVDARNAQAGGDLGSHDGDAGSGNEGGDGDVGNELNDPPQAQEPEEKHNGTSEYAQSVGNIFVAVHSR